MVFPEYFREEPGKAKSPQNNEVNVYGCAVPSPEFLGSGLRVKYPIQDINHKNTCAVCYPKLESTTNPNMRLK